MPDGQDQPTLSLSGGFLLLTAWFVLENGWGPLAAILPAAMVHEAGHWLALTAFHVPVTALRIRCAGAVLDADRSRLTYAQDLTAVLAGPCGNLVCGGLLAACADRWDWLYLAAGAHWMLALFNLLPIRALDGGQALRLLLLWRRGPDAAGRICGAVSWGCALLVCGLLLFAIRKSGGSLWLLPAAGAILFAA